MTLHFPAIAHEAGLNMSLEKIAELSETTPYLAKIKPSGSHTMRDLEQAGGVLGVLNELDGIVDLDQMTVNGLTHRQNIAVRKFLQTDHEVIHTVKNPYAEHGSICVLKGNLAPLGSVVKQSAVVPEMRQHSGPGALL